MRHLKTYEALITLNLEQNDLILLMDDAVSKNKPYLVKTLLQNGLDPNYRPNINNSTQILKAAYYGDTKLEIVKLFIEYGADLNITTDNKTMIEMLLENIRVDYQTLQEAAKDLQRMSNVIILLIKSGEEISPKFMEDLLSLTKRHKNIRTTAIELFDRIKNECTEQYEKYLLDMESKKYNL